MPVTLRLTKNFWLDEFLVSEEHPQLIRDVKLRDSQVDKLLYLCAFCLQPLRDKFGPCKVLSGFRTKMLNSAIGGSPRSQHMDAEASDIVFPKSRMLDVYGYLVGDLKYVGEVIYYKSSNFVHVSLPKLNVKMDHFIKE